MRILLTGFAFLMIAIVAAIGPSYASSSVEPNGPKVTWQPCVEYVEDTTREHDDRLAAYVYGAMTSWASESHDEALWRGIAADIASTTASAPEALLLASLAFHAAYVYGAMTSWASESHDETLWRGIAADIASTTASAPEALLLASLAFHEGRFRAYVDEQQCNDPIWRASRDGRIAMASGGDCDGGWAYSLWQIHPLDARTTARELRDRRAAARIALTIARRGPCAYTGESGPCPKGETRWRVVRAYSAAHPFP